MQIIAALIVGAIIGFAFAIPVLDPYKMPPMDEFTRRIHQEAQRNGWNAVLAEFENDIIRQSEKLKDNMEYLKVIDREIRGDEERREELVNHACRIAHETFINLIIDKKQHYDISPTA